MVGGEFGERGGDDVDTHYRNFLRYEYVVKPEQGKTRRKGRAQLPGHMTAHIAQSTGKPFVGWAGRDRVEIAEQHDRLAGRAVVAQPFGAEQDVRLAQPVDTPQAEMGVEDLQAAFSDRHLDPERTTLFAYRRQRSSLYQFGREGGEYRIAIPLLLHIESGVEVMLHLEDFGDRMRLIDATGPPSSDIEFLQADNVRLLRRDHLGDAFRCQSPVGADAAVHIIGQEFQAVGNR